MDINMSQKPKPEDSSTKYIAQAPIDFYTLDEEEMDLYDLEEDMNNALNLKETTSTIQAALQAFTDYYAEMDTIDCTSDSDEGNFLQSTKYMAPMDSKLDLAQPVSNSSGCEIPLLHLTRTDTISWSSVANEDHKIGEDHHHQIPESSDATAWGIASAPCYPADELEEQNTDESDPEADLSPMVFIG